MLIGVVSGVSRGMGILDVKEEGAVLGVNVGHPIVIPIPFNGDTVA